MFRKISTAALLCMVLFATALASVIGVVATAAPLSRSGQILKSEFSDVVASVPATAMRALHHQIPASVLLQNIREPGNFVGLYGTYDQLSSGEIKFGSHSDVVSEHAQACLKAIDQAIAAGVPESKTIDLKFRDGNRTMSLAELRSLCGRVAGVAGQGASLREATQAATNASYWPSHVQDTDFSGPNGRVAADAANQCISAIDKALASNNPGSTRIELIGDNKMTLSEAREMCVYVRDAGNKQVKVDVAAEEAQYEPFRKLLTGDKLRVYNERKKYKLYTTGGRVLKTPESYRDASVWCTVGVNRDGILPVWDMSCWRFRGMTQVGGVINKSRTGEEPPSSAFP